MLNECGSKALIQVDGGVSDKNAEDLARSGANVLVCGNYVFKADDPIENIRRLHQIAI